MNTSSFVLPEPEDTAIVSVIKPFLSSDVFRFVAKKGFTDIDQAKADLNKIKVVPNPYMATCECGNQKIHIAADVVPVQYILLIYRINVP